MARKVIKIPKKFTFKMKRKLVLVFVIVVLALLALSAKIFYIMYTEGETYTKTVLSQQSYDSRTIAYRRGDILDSKGNILATSEDVYNVILDCKVVNSNEDYVGTTIAALTKCFDITESEIRQILEDYPESQYYILYKKISYEETQKLQEMIDNPEDYGTIKGVWFEKSYARVYPLGSLASSVVGFTTSSNEGMTGLENYYNSTLNGSYGREYGYLDSETSVSKTVIDATDGESIMTTIDINIQKEVEKQIDKFLKKYKNNAKKGNGAENIGVIVMDPNDGSILAMADYPDYDLSDPWDLTAYYKDEEIEDMSEEDQLDALNQIWQNFCVTSTFEPGSTIKPFTVATGLETGTLSGNETYVCDGVEKVGGHQIHCVNRGGHGTETVEGALMDSCNDAIMQMAFQIGKENIVTYQNIFNFGLKTNIDLPGEARTDSLVYTLDTMDDASLATNAFGQNFNVTMIQVAAGFSSLINGGYYYQPHLLKKTLDSNGNTLSEYSTTLLKQTVSTETSDTVKGYLYNVVDSGTGTTAKVKGYSMGGKTGTAQKLPRGNGNYVVSFIGYAPQDDPEVVIYVVIDEPNVEDQAHSSYAQEITRKILKNILPYMGVYQDEKVKGKKSDEDDSSDGTTDVPDENLDAEEEEQSEEEVLDTIDTMEEETE